MSTVGKPIDYTGHVVQSLLGWAKYRVLCKDGEGGYVCQSVKSRERFMLLDRKALDENWEVVA